ncbi:clathrin heavy chain 2 [Patella vulgata]|uniref:clathrin heavy chain 2 n=1 Tax=Patella vulgata TaxID=6465 RepID=UPI0021807977|nr:clathrin heavy chain 2 [Patella vulgata]
MQTDKGQPITITEMVQLAHIGVPLDQVTWARVTMISDRWIAIRHGNREENSQKAMVTVLNPKDGTISYAGQTTADSVIMNPSQPIMALKAGLRFEVFNLDTKVLISKTRLHEPVVYWTWVSSDVIGMVTETAIYHWDLWQGNCPPEKMFMRHTRLAFSEIVSYKADPGLKWLAVTGMIPEDDKISGITQLYNAEEDITQCIAAHAVCFASYRFNDNPSPSTLFFVCTRDVQDHGKVHVIELGPYKPGNFAPRNCYDHVQYLDDPDRYDFPVSLQVSSEYGLLFVITKYGYLYICDIQTATCLCCARISMDIIFASALNTDTQGILGVTRGGQVLTIDLEKDSLISYLRETGKKSYQATRLEKAINTQ